jgi:hypothetical protein
MNGRKKRRKEKTTKEYTVLTKFVKIKSGFLTRLLKHRKFGEQ